ncbi:hypothetical protein NQ318_023339 [Aromia moschata]|uniref:Uncharacterized protein n=1 Tax=Aromia moschata TaxID=1265417 RepID=A0AAV8XRQ8_9CUCU|nr:hypothetical protein NQ318_023339 [Aromia moschata]
MTNTFVVRKCTYVVPWELSVTLMFAADKYFRGPWENFVDRGNFLLLSSLPPTVFNIVIIKSKFLNNLKELVRKELKFYKENYEKWMSRRLFYRSGSVLI